MSNWHLSFLKMDLNNHRKFRKILYNFVSKTFLFRIFWNNFTEIAFFAHETKTYFSILHIISKKCNFYKIHILGGDLKHICVFDDNLCKSNKNYYKLIRFILYYWNSHDQWLSPKIVRISSNILFCQSSTDASAL